MFMAVRYEIPHGLSDGSKWFKWFSTRSLIVFLCVGGLGIIVIKLLSFLGFTLYLIVFWLLLTFALTALTAVRIPSSNWLNGGGNYIDQFILKRFFRKKNRCLYIKGYDQPLYEKRIREEFKKNKGEKQV